jgi:hypothetical protein
MFNACRREEQEALKVKRFFQGGTIVVGAVLVGAALTQGVTGHQGGDFAGGTPMSDDGSVQAADGGHADGSPCGPTGTRFNLEGDAGTPPATFPYPQQEESIDAIGGGGLGGADLVVEGAEDFRGFYNAPGTTEFTYYVHRTGNDCKPQYEGGMPPVTDPLTGGLLYGFGNGVVRRDATRGTFFIADRHLSSSNGKIQTGGTTSIVVQRATVANLNNPTLCPDGTHTVQAARQCWPTSVVLSPHTGANTLWFEDKPHMVVDERASGIGSGNVYVTASEHNLSTGQETTWLVACTNTLSACSSPLSLAGSVGSQFSHVAVRPDGIIAVSFESFSQVLAVGTGSDSGSTPPGISGGLGIPIEYVTCTPAAAPTPPTCGAPTIVATLTHYDGLLGSEDFQSFSYAKHAHRMNGPNLESFMVWEQCDTTTISKLDTTGNSQQRLSICPKVQVVMSESVNGGTWSTPQVIDTAPGDQFFPWIDADRTSGAVHIAYYTTENDYFRHKLQVKLADIDAGGIFPEAVSRMRILTRVADDPSADPYLGGTLFGDYIGVVGIGSKVYVGYHADYIRGIFGTATHTQRDNYLIVADIR